MISLLLRVSLTIGPRLADLRLACAAVRSRMDGLVGYFCHFLSLDATLASLPQIPMYLSNNDYSLWRRMDATQGGAGGCGPMIYSCYRGMM